MIDWIKTHPKETILIIAISSATIIAVYCLGHEMGASNVINVGTQSITDTIVTLKQEVADLTTRLATSNEIINTMQSTLNSTATELVNANEKFTNITSVLTTFATATNENNKVLLELLVRSRKNWDLLANANMRTEDYLMAMRSIGRLLTKAIDNLEPIVEKATEILINLNHDYLL